MYVLKCAHEHVYVCMYVYVVCIYVCMHVLCMYANCLSWSFELAIWLDCLADKSSGTTCLYFPLALGYRHEPLPSPAFIWMLRIQTQGLMFAEEVFYQA